MFKQSEKKTEVTVSAINKPMFYMSRPGYPLLSKIDKIKAKEEYQQQIAAFFAENPDEKLMYEKLADQRRRLRERKMVNRNVGTSEEE